MTSFIPSGLGREFGGSEGRADPRKILRANAELVTPDRKLEVRTLDISTSAIGNPASVNPRVGQTFPLLLAPPDAPRGTARVEMSVSVVHSILTSAEGEFKVGLRFGQLSPAAIDLVRKYLLP